MIAFVFELTWPSKCKSAQKRKLSLGTVERRWMEAER